MAEDNSLNPKENDLRQAAAQELLRRQKARTNLIDFTRYTFPTYIAEPAHELIASKLDDVINGRIKRLMISIPPQHGKSELASVRMPAFWLGKRPDDPIILCSYGASLAESKSRQARQVVESREYNLLFQGASTRKDSRSISEWQINQGRGYLVAAGVSGPITGKGCMLGIIDDPLKDWQEAQSQTIRDACWDWYRTTFLTRVWEAGAIIVIQTRWHEDDLAGRLIKEQPGKWEVLRLPAIAETQNERDENDEFLGLSRGNVDPLGRSPGDPLCPRRYSLEALESLRNAVGPSGFAALYQGVPRATEGNQFHRNWFQLTESVPYEAKRVRAWDKAGTKGEGDYTVGALVAMHEGKFYVEDIVRGRWLAGERDKIMRTTAEQDATRYKNKVVIWVEQEPGSGGKDSAQSSIQLLAGFPVYVDKVSGPKEVRANPFAAQGFAMNVYMKRGPWNTDLLNEFLAFPNGKHDDIVDAVCMAFNKLAIGVGLTPTVRVYGLKTGGLNLGAKIPKKQIRIAVCSKEELEFLHLDQECVLISIVDPNTTHTVPPHRCERMLGRIELSFADIDPNSNECTDWSKEIEPWGQTAEELMMSREQARKMWGFILKKRDVPPITYIIQDNGNGDRRALSMALGISDGLGFVKGKAVYLVNNPDFICEEEPSNKHIYQLCKSTRYMVI
ncbi:hypothetical protein C4577_03635 [Candidatus Parcubacteria bacterium]|nr:MAG: hypothetical protein C4577_03635 [Candidatus Parcubacteria bacterium]